MLQRPAAPQTARSLIEAGIPVLLPVYETFYLVYGFDDSRSIVNAYSFAQLSAMTRAMAVKEAQEVLMLKDEGHGRTKEQLARIEREAGCMWSLDQWQSGRLADAAPWMAVIHPMDGRGAVAKALGQAPETLTRIHHGLLAAQIALTYVDNADPINCIRWARIAARRVDVPLVRQAAHLGATLWQNRSRRIGAAFQLENQFAVLGEVDRFMETPDVRDFLETARCQFSADLAAGRLTWPVRHRLLTLMDRHDAEQRRQMIALVQADVATNPADADRWRQLADLFALDGDASARTRALAQAWSAAPWDAATALRWASACAMQNDPAQVERILQKIDPSEVRFEADYPFCLAVIAEWKNRPREAMRYYARATDLCRYRPAYYQRYGRLLTAQGDTEAGGKALAWAARIDGGPGRAGRHNIGKQAP